MEKKRGIDSFTLHILAMLFMLCDHLWATLFPAQEWMTCVGRLAFPIFAFMIAEGCYYFLFFSQENLDFFCGTACRAVLFECSYAGESVLSGNDSGTSF